MNIINLELENGCILVFKINCLAIVIILFILFCISFFMKIIIKMLNKKSITVNQINLGIGNSNVEITYNKKDQEIAYKIWVELSTRKIGLQFDEENDVIKEVYDSWYMFFGIVRELLKEIPVDRLLYDDKLIELTEKVLNIGLRPHLTRWQAKYRKWYEEALKDNNRTPQEIQKEYPEYSTLIDDLLETNKRMIEYKNLMKKIAFDENEK